MVGNKTGALVAALLGLVVCVLPAAAWAQADYPSKAVEIVSPYPAGGSADLFTRVVADKLKEYTGQPFVVLNKPGAGTALGAAFLAALGVGAVTEFEQITAWVEISPALQPRLPASEKYDKIYPVYAGLYARLKEDFDRLTALTTQ